MGARPGGTLAESEPGAATCLCATPISCSSRWAWCRGSRSRPAPLTPTGGGSTSRLTSPEAAASPASRAASPGARCTTRPGRKAPSRLLPAPGLPARPHPARHVPRLRHQADCRPVGRPRLRLQPSVRGARHAADDRHAGRCRRAPDGRARYPHVAHPPPLGREGPRARRLCNGKECCHRQERSAPRPRRHHVVRPYRSRRVRYVADGRDAGTVAPSQTISELTTAMPPAIKEVCIDMSGACIKGVANNLTETEITFDKFHAVKLANDAVDKVRRAGAKIRHELKRSPLSLAQERTEPLCRADGPARPACQAPTSRRRTHGVLRLAFQEVYAMPSRAWGELTFNR